MFAFANYIQIYFKGEGNLFLLKGLLDITPTFKFTLQTTIFFQMF